MTRPLENITVNGQPLKVYVEEQQRTEIEKVHEDEMRQKSAGIGYMPATGKYGNISGERTERRDRTAILFSPEVKAHVDYLARFEGAKAVAEYLNRTREERGGTIETALKDAKERLSFLRREEQTLVLEKTRYEQVVEQLERTLQLLTGKTEAAKEKKVAGKRGPYKKTGLAKGAIKQFIKNTLLTQPLGRKDLWDKLLVFNGNRKDAAYQAIHSSIRSGAIEEQNGLLHWIGK